jgi:hypothetical protein
MATVPLSAMPERVSGTIGRATDYPYGDGIDLAATVPTKAMRRNARMALVFCAPYCPMQ